MARVIIGVAFAACLLSSSAFAQGGTRTTAGRGTTAGSDATVGSPATGTGRSVRALPQRTVGQTNNDMTDSRVAHPGDRHDRQSLGEILRSRQPLNFDPRFLPRHREESDTH